jgi:hypothetical protein
MRRSREKQEARRKTQEARRKAEGVGRRQEIKIKKFHVESFLPNLMLMKISFRNYLKTLFKMVFSLLL